MEYHEVVEACTNSWCDHSLKLLMKNDQLNRVRGREKFLSRYQEMPITFLPTYKFDKNCDTFDTSKKMRIPAYTDRILWYQSEKYIKPLSYERKRNQFSDHRPVLAYFDINAYEHEEEAKTSKQRDLYQGIRKIKSDLQEEKKQEQITLEVDDDFFNPSKIEAPNPTTQKFDILP